MVVNTGELDPPATIAVKLSSTISRNNYGDLHAEAFPRAAVAVITTSLSILCPKQTQSQPALHDPRRRDITVWLQQ